MDFICFLVSHFVENRERLASIYFCSFDYYFKLYFLRNKALGADSVVNEVLKYGGSDVRNKLLKIVNMIFEKGEVPNYFRKPLIKPLYKKGDKSE